MDSFELSMNVKVMRQDLQHPLPLPESTMESNSKNLDLEQQINRLDKYEKTISHVTQSV